MGEQENNTNRTLTCDGTIQYMTFDLTNVGSSNVIKLNTKHTEHWTRYGELQEVLLDMFKRNVDINLLTEDCYENGHEFSSVQILEDPDINF